MTWTKIRIKKTTKKRIESFGRMNDNFDSFITEMLDHTKWCDSWFEDRYQ